MNINIFNTPDEVLNQLALFFAETAKSCIALHNRFSVSLSGGSSPKKLYELLASEYKHKIEWNKVFFFFGDERYVPHTDPESNYLMVKKALFDPLGIDSSNIFPVDTSLTPKEAAGRYTEVINNFFKNTTAHFDLVLLGLGDDAHTASLFPHTSVLHETNAAAKEVFLEDKKVYRITMAAPLINQAHQIAFLVYGEGKAEAVHNVLKGKRNIEQFPAQLISPINGMVNWFLDRSANAVNAGFSPLT